MLTEFIHALTTEFDSVTAFKGPNHRIEATGNDSLCVPNRQIEIARSHN